jgi:hypothetical protein
MLSRETDVANHGTRPPEWTIFLLHRRRGLRHLVMRSPHPLKCPRTPGRLVTMELAVHWRRRHRKNQIGFHEGRRCPRCKTLQAKVPCRPDLGPGGSM